MKLEEALNLKKGDRVRAIGSSDSPVITQGKEYVLQRDAVPIHSSALRPRAKRLGQRTRPIDAFLPILDDSGEYCGNVCYQGFEIGERK